MKVYCAWCARYMGEKEFAGRATSHTICQECYQKLIIASQLEAHHVPSDSLSSSELVTIK